MIEIWCKWISVCPSREQEGDGSQSRCSLSTIVRSWDCNPFTRGPFYRLLSKRMALSLLGFRRSLKLLLENRLEGTTLKSKETN